ncbi:hypothetical protein KPH14_005306 [Odynerus spinipes]|uniref:Uncharacterized protein n=1 Tax=Odynerus spinipes TaxID=1348599 RepID=A0AAD9RBF8_9HYME|nr:hypothetical protein KPH14_005306 [Odynerus spinipes]
MEGCPDLVPIVTPISGKEYERRCPEVAKIAAGNYRPPRTRCVLTIKEKERIRNILHRLNLSRNEPRITFDVERS